MMTALPRETGEGGKLYKGNYRAEPSGEKYYCYCLKTHGENNVSERKYKEGIESF